jgi:hypothetical protein
MKKRGVLVYITWKEKFSASFDQEKGVGRNSASIFEPSNKRHFEIK